MKTIKEQLDALTPEQRSQLMVAFELGVSQHIELPDGRFIGVNVETIKALQPDNKVGTWATGIIKRS